jgi:hypothetical protein
MRPVSVFAKGPGREIEQLRAELQGRWRQATRAAVLAEDETQPLTRSDAGHRRALDQPLAAARL